MALLEVSDLTMHYATKKGEVKAVDDVSFSLERGEALGLVGESGCGKTSVALTLLKLLPENARFLKGHAHFKGQDLVAMPEEEMRKVRWKGISMIFQAAMNSLNPFYRVGDQIVEAIQTQSILILATALMGFSLISTEVSYIKFIESLRSMKLSVQSAERDARSGAVRFVLLFENPMGAEVFLEAISYSLCLEEHEEAVGAFGARTLRCPSGRAFLGAYNTTDGSGPIKERLQVTIATDLGHYARRVDGPIYLAGNAQLRLGEAQRIVKLQFRGVIHE